MIDFQTLCSPIKKSLRRLAILIIPVFVGTATYFLILNTYGCSESTSSQPGPLVDTLAVPPGFPPMPFPAYNPYSSAKSELGRWLFYEPMLSRDNNIPSCSHCMKQEHSFSDDIAVSAGNDNEPEYRNTMSTTNSGYRNPYFWDGRNTAANGIELTAYRSIWLSYILGADTNVVAQRLQNHPLYPEMFRKAFGSDAKPSAYLASLAIATFARTLISGNSNYDKYIRGNKSALNQNEINGMNLFFSDRTRCSVCHSGYLFTDLQFHNTATSTHYFDRGRFYVTNDQRDRYKFLTPSLRNVEVTAPYIHDGEFYNIEDLINNYNAGGHNFIGKDTLIRPLNLSDQEKADILAFLKSLTDHEFLTNPKFGDPHINYQIGK
jgi:cytochrome c peroxidase